MTTLLFRIFRNVAGSIQLIPLFGSQYRLLDSGHPGVKHEY